MQLHRIGYAVVTGIPALGSLLFGYDAGTLAWSLLTLRGAFALTPIMEGVISSVALGGAVLGAAFGGPLADRRGRRPTLMLAAVCFFVGEIGMSLAPSTGWFIAFRIVTGLGIGAASLVVPLYLAEIAPARSRGARVTLNQLGVPLGLLLAYLVASFIPTDAWRWLFGLAAIPGVLLLLGMALLTDSPRWLVAHGAEARARQVLTREHTPDEVEAEIRLITSSLRQHNDGRYLLRDAHIRHVLFIGVALAITQQVMGINAIGYYLPTLARAAGAIAPTAAVHVSLLVSVVNLLGVIAALLLVDRLGRRPLLLTGMAAMIVCLALLGHLLNIPLPDATARWSATVVLAGYFGSYAFGLGTVFWLLIAEIYPLPIRGAAMALAVCVNWLASLTATLVFPLISDRLGYGGTAWAFALAGVPAWLLAVHIVPETKGRRLEAIDAI